MFNQLTQKDIEAMEAEIEERKLVIRPRLLEAVKEARAHGDLSENFEYYAAKREKNKNESRIRFLEKMIKTAEVISDSSEEDEVGMNKTVEVEFEEAWKFLRRPCERGISHRESAYGTQSGRSGLCAGQCAVWLLFKGQIGGSLRK